MMCQFTLTTNFKEFDRLIFSGAAFFLATKDDNNMNCTLK
jgi:hypothetical protein